MNYWLLFVPILSAILGWVGIWIVAKIFFYKIIPRRQEFLAQKIGKTVSDEFSFSDIEKKITDPGNIKKIMPVVDEHIDDFLRNKLKAKMPVVGMFIGDKTINSLKEVFLKEIEDLFPEVLKHFTGNLQKEINIEEMIRTRITNVSAAKMEKTALPALRYFYFSGAITGFILGTVNLIIFYLINK